MIQVSHLSKIYGNRAAIRDLCFEVKRGEIVGFLGPNGAGKSTTMKIITGFMPATEGHVQVAGHDVFERPLQVKKHIGFLPETPPVYPEMKVFDYLQFTARLHQVPSRDVNKSAQMAIDKTGLGDVANRLIGNLSKGYRQRVGLAQALAHNPDVLILDEPTVGLDPQTNHRYSRTHQESRRGSHGYLKFAHPAGSNRYLPAHHRHQSWPNCGGRYA